MKQPQRTEPGRPTDERLAKAAGYFETADSRGSAGTMTMRDCPLERALSRGQITRQEYEAAIKFRHHWFHAGMAGQVSSLDLDRIFARDFSTMGHMAKTEQQAFHRQKFREAMDEMGEKNALAVEYAVCAEIEFDQIGRKFGYKNDPQARAAALAHMQSGLYRLTKLWGL